MMAAGITSDGSERTKAELLDGKRVGDELEAVAARERGA